LLDDVKRIIFVAMAVAWPTPYQSAIRMPDQHVGGGEVAVYEAAIVQRRHSFPDLPHQGRDACVGKQ